METNRKREGLLKRKLMMSFYRAAKPASSTVQYDSKVKPIPSAGSVVGIIVSHNHVTPQSNQKVSFVPLENHHDESYTKFENFYGVVEDEGVDMKAATYIAYVQERFRLE
ncbi:hypothetical protein LOK49_LG01G04219 [Camellia lanceoleosa]|uniref:Uncharacterized protein n=1 Tax=Camellia lanceoleosa TaxID=1840588 RepID=A0ACC0IYE3_9ERIC|nr:hypothetical protein LOK49_LG01G04219 [Camellia lanceoleosa]